LVGGSRPKDGPVTGRDRSRPIEEGAFGKIWQALLTLGGLGEGPKRSLGSQRVLHEVKAIADTGFLVAYANRSDAHHDWALAIAEEIDDPLLTCEPVLAEAAFHLRSVRTVLGMVEDGLVEIAFDCKKHLLQLTALAKRYEDRQPDLADLCVVRMSELYPRHDVITVDREDFLIYRRNRREVIPLICPPRG
jgi:predicted nucleic acid-binding protein